MTTRAWLPKSPPSGSPPFPWAVSPTLVFHVQPEARIHFKCSIFISGFVGPSAAGFFFEQLNFFYTALIFMGVNATLVLRTPFYILFKYALLTIDH